MHLYSQLLIHREQKSVYRWVGMLNGADNPDRQRLVLAGIGLFVLRKFQVAPSVRRARPTLLPLFRQRRHGVAVSTLRRLAAPLWQTAASAG